MAKNKWNRLVVSAIFFGPLALVFLEWALRYSHDPSKAGEFVASAVMAAGIALLVPNAISPKDLEKDATEAARRIHLADQVMIWVSIVVMVVGVGFWIGALLAHLTHQGPSFLQVFSIGALGYENSQALAFYLLSGLLFIVKMEALTT